MFVACPATIGIPNIQSLNRKLILALVHALKAINSDKNELVSIICWRLLYHIIGAQFMNMRYPVCDLLVFLLAACDASTNAVVVTVRPISLG